MTSSTTADPCGARPHFGNARCDRPAGHDGDHSARIAIGGRVEFAAPYTANREHPPMNDKPNHPAPDLDAALDEFARYLATAARLAGARIAAALIPDPADDPRRRADADATAALRDDLTHALGSDHLARLALRAVEPALLAVEVDTAQRMQDDVDHWRARAEAAERRADEQQQRAQRAEADAAAHAARAHLWKDTHA